MILKFEWVGPTFITMMQRVEMKSREPSQIVAIVAMVSMISKLDSGTTQSDGEVAALLINQMTRGWILTMPSDTAKFGMPAIQTRAFP